MSTNSNVGAAIRAALAKPAPQVFRVPRAPRWLSLCGLVILVIVTLPTIAAAVLIFRMNWPLGLFSGAVAALMVALVDYVWRDFRGIMTDLMTDLAGSIRPAERPPCT